MDPIRTAAANFVYRGPAENIGDLWVQRVPENAPRYRAQEVRSVWDLDRDERALIADGGRIELALYGAEPIPPVSLIVLPEGLCRPVAAHEFRVDRTDMPPRVG
jgi:hypothetical protein